MTKLGERIRTRRKQLGMSQEDLASYMSTIQRQISHYETGDNSPTAEVLVRLAQALETSLDYLVGLTDDPSRRDVSENDL
jgi:transcriptional regulator with XRE-family HTH domain